MSNFSANKRVFILFILHNCLKNSYARLRNLVVPVDSYLLISSWTNSGHDRGRAGLLIDICVLSGIGIVELRIK